MRKHIMKKIPFSAYLVVSCVILLCLLVFLIDFRINAQATGSAIGENTGILVGKVVGSFEGLSVGQKQGYDDGRADAIVNPNITVALSEKMKEVQRLQVLVASGTHSDIYRSGEEVEYAALLSQKYNAVFTVDLGTAEIELQGDGLHILLEQPVIEFIPVGECKKLAEYQKGSYTGSVEQAYLSVIEMANQIRIKVAEEFTQNEAIMKAARISAETQLVQLVNAVSISKPNVFVEFKD